MKLLVVALVLLSLLVGFAINYAQVPYTCVRCRLRLVETYVWGYSVRRRYQENACSRWYAATLGAHEHQWGVAGCVRELDGISNIGHHAVIAVSPDDQQQYLARATPAERERWWALLESNRPELQNSAIAMAVSK